MQEMDDFQLYHPIHGGPYPGLLFFHPYPSITQDQET